MKKEYLPPVIEIEEVVIEKGFANSNPISEWNQDVL